MYEKEYETAREVIKRAGEELKNKTALCMDSDEGRDIKTSADRSSEKILMEGLGGFGYSVLSEEYGFKDEGSEYIWIIDPLDGTMNYVKGMDDLACVSLALYKGEEPVFGMIYRFMRDELFSGMTGKGACLNDVPIRPSETVALKQAVLATGFPLKRSYDTASLSAFVSKVQSFKKIRMLGAAAIMGAYVACGRVDAYVEEDIMIWDVAAAAAIVRASGGCTEIISTGENKCICRLFANQRLYEEYENACL